MAHNNSRAPKLLGDFGEGLVTYALIRKGFEVACVDHVGADLIAEKDEYKIAVSVKTRLYRHGTKESRGTVFTFDHLNKLDHFANRFDLDPVLAHAVCIADDNIIHLFIIRTENIRNELSAVKHGHRFQFGPKYLSKTIALPYVDYSQWARESITDGLFAGPTPQTDAT